ncbi:hypothetical protein BGZ75_006544 [Mortierella antarctica]|nr:hypothetical protein BGZ75_006544 [Mortierella antarctica]
MLPSLSWPIIPLSIASDSDRHQQQTDSSKINGNGAVAELESVWDGIETTDVFENDREHRRCPRYQDHDDDDDDDDDDSDDEDDGDYSGETIGDIDVYLDMESERQENQEEEEDKQAGALDTLLETIEDMAVNEVSALVELIGLAQEELQNNNKNHLSGALQGMEDSLTDSLLSDTQIAEEEQDVNSVDHDGFQVDVQEPAFLSLARRRHHHKVHSASRTGEVEKEVESGELDEPDEDERDHYPSHLGHGADDNDNTTINDGTDDKEDHDDEEEDHGGDDEHDHERAGGGGGGGNSKDKNKPPHTKQKPKPKHNSHQDHNANLGGTGGNGPILLCSSRSCLPGLRDYILAKLSVQIHHVMSHLLNQQTLLYMMDSTAPQTKELLMAGQEDLVQQIEDQVIQDLKDWVNGVARSNDTHKTVNKSRPVEHTKTTSTLPPTTPAATATVSDPATGDNNPAEDGEGEDGDVSTAEVTVDFLAGDDDEIYGGDDEDGFQMESLDLDDDEDDDDEDHEFDKSPALIKKKKQQQRQKQQQQQQQQQQEHQQPTKGIHKSSSTLQMKKRDAAPARSVEGGGNNGGGGSGSNSNNNNNNNAHVYFLSADKALMRQEWSRWIAHWVHHAKLLILSHTLATRTVTEMNQIAVAGGNVVSQDQRHWAWNLDKALATVMVASEMLCGGPAQPKQVAEFLSTLSSPHTSGDPKQTQKSVDLTVNAQKCIEAWRADLEEVLKRTATIA